MGLGEKIHSLKLFRLPYLWILLPHKLRHLRLLFSVCCYSELLFSFHFLFCYYCLFSYFDYKSIFGIVKYYSWIIFIFFFTCKYHAKNFFLILFSFGMKLYFDFLKIFLDIADDTYIIRIWKTLLLQMKVRIQWTKFNPMNFSISSHIISLIVAASMFPMMPSYAQLAASISARS